MTGKGSEPWSTPLTVVSGSQRPDRRRGNWPPNTRLEWDSDHRSRSSRRPLDIMPCTDNAVELKSGTQPYEAQQISQSMPPADQHTPLAHFHPLYGLDPLANIDRFSHYQDHSGSFAESNFQPRAYQSRDFVDDREQGSLSQWSSYDPLSRPDPLSSDHGVIHPSSLYLQQSWTTKVVFPLSSHMPQSSPSSNLASFSGILPLEPSYNHAQPVSLNYHEYLDLKYVSSPFVIVPPPEFGVSCVSPAAASLDDAQSHEQQLTYYYTQGNQSGHEEDANVSLDMQNSSLSGPSSTSGWVCWDSPNNFSFSYGQHPASFHQDGPSQTIEASQDSFHSTAPAAESYDGVTEGTHAQSRSAIPDSPVPSVPPLTRDEELLLSPQSIQPITPADTNSTISSSPSPAVELKNDLEEDDVEQHQCEKCSRSFSKKHALNKHSKTHDKPHKCSFKACRYHLEGFAVKRDKNRHQNNKHGEAPKHYCPIKACQRHLQPFGRADNLQRHLREIHRSS